MIIKPRIRGFICTTAHPTGCRTHIEKQIKYITDRSKIKSGPKRVLIIGASTGYGLSSRITAAFGCSASTVGVFFERPGLANKPGSAGWYNSAVFEELATIQGLYAFNVNGDAYSYSVQNKTVELIKKDLGQVDLIIYSLAAPRCTHPQTGKVFNAVLKPIGKPLKTRGINTDTEKMIDISLTPASPIEIHDTVTVMGGENWYRWIYKLIQENALAKGAKTIAFTYLGGKITHDIYWNGSIGSAKKDLDKYALSIRDMLIKHCQGDARVAVLRSVVTQSSAAIPMMSLYLSLLFKIMKEKKIHEGCIEQIYGLFNDNLYSPKQILDNVGRIRMDAVEITNDIQETIFQLWNSVNNNNLYTMTDIIGYKKEFMKLFGFHWEDVNYDKHVNPILTMRKII
ncbi:enoyl-ACP reductase FabV [Candidatus Erwinia haradaeae]|uniref:Enoyl-[acyl-carrier-protein] reductase [NADH] n=1 Tax=Candidatus Erwinia haradaeae TaxID=1922217 RepID=A0A451D2Z7_9GAMM|nr:enoyl-ACP reductase FabV [Candidatus Erwinia haradaeae]VFP80017.1 Enoyl-[acyl-carrier-protein] reductase [NADH] [Candidatus Erwinia haradaeae]